MKLLVSLVLMAAALAAQGKLTPVDQASYPKVIAAHKGKVVLANFWATWCVPCRKEMPQLVQLSHKLAARGFDLVMISADEAEQQSAAAKLLQDNRAEGANYLLRTADNDKFYPAVYAKWSSGELPALFLYDRSGKKVRSFFGETSIADLEAAITKLL
ncbi:MAG TPA: TlpA disulfide reductase family protein [Bryobacteraceae bacterium]|nr:TlpA disulfide reductase family protein [Bryobacteraceae bacterium]